MRNQVLRGEKPNGRHANALRTVDQRLREVRQNFFSRMSIIIRPQILQVPYPRGVYTSTGSDQHWGQKKPAKLIFTSNRNSVRSPTTTLLVICVLQIVAKATGWMRILHSRECWRGFECRGSSSPQLSAKTESSSMESYVSNFCPSSPFHTRLRIRLMVNTLLPIDHTVLHLHNVFNLRNECKNNG